MSAVSRRAGCAGFSLVEVMVALVVISVGLLGIAKMQALALSSTSTARERSLAAIEAASLASTMRADRGYWANVAADPNVAVTTTPTSSSFTATGDSTLVAPTSGQCQSVTACTTPAVLAAEDLTEWAAALSTAIPNGSATVNCTVGTATAPTSCKITLTWTENLVQLNTTTNTALTSTATNTAVQNIEQTKFTLFVDP
jgi:type IV pilus assembly protein PilV